jgi:hypothetical protein
VDFSKTNEGKASVKFTGDWQYPDEIVAIKRNGKRAREGIATSMSFFGHSATAEFDCAPEDVAEVHFRMCGIQRFVIEGIAADPGVKTTPRLRVEHIHPTLNGQGPARNGKVPDWDVHESHD